MITIHTDSEAGKHLARILADPDTYKVTIQPRGLNVTFPAVAIKRNEGMWTAPLPTEFGR